MRIAPEFRISCGRFIFIKVERVRTFRCINRAHLESYEGAHALVFVVPVEDGLQLPDGHLRVEVRRRRPNPIGWLGQFTCKMSASDKCGASKIVHRIHNKESYGWAVA